MLGHIHNFSSDTKQIISWIPLHQKNTTQAHHMIIAKVTKEFSVWTKSHTKCMSIIGTRGLLRFITKSHGTRNFSLPTWNDLQINHFYLMNINCYFSSNRNTIQWTFVYICWFKMKERLCFSHFNWISPREASWFCYRNQCLHTYQVS